MKGKGRPRVQVEKGPFERRRAEKQKVCGEDQRALEAGQVTAKGLRQWHGLFTGLEVCMNLHEAKSFC